MRVVTLHLLAVALLLVDCGSKQDLVIGELAPIAEAGGHTAGSGASSTDAGGATSAAGAGGSKDRNSAGADAGQGGAEAGAGGAPEVLTETCVAGEEPPAGSLVHRYSFDDTGAVATDSVGGADGDVIGTELDGSGSVSMDGTTREYVDLPNGIVSSLTDVTLVAWMTWAGGAAYQRVLDFGISDQGEGLGASGKSYLAVMPMTGFDNQAKPGLGAEIKASGLRSITLASTESMKNRPAQVALVLRGGERASLYLDGNLLASQATDITLADIDDRNNWLGQSQYQTDPEYQGSFEEFRIYDAALNGCQLHSLLFRGPQAP